MAGVKPPVHRRELAVGVALAVFALVGWMWNDPHLQVPVLSQIVCDVKGGTWVDQPSFFYPQAGCYSRPSS